MKNCVAAHDGSVRSDGRIVQFCYGGDGSWPKFTTTCEFAAGELERALEEAREDGDGELALAVEALQGIKKPSVPVPFDWIAGRPDPRPADPRLRARDRQAVIDAALRLRPYEPSRTTRAVLLVKFRRSERERIGLTGAR